MGRHMTVAHPLSDAEVEHSVLPPVEVNRDDKGEDRLDWRQVSGVTLALAGVVMVSLAWLGISGTISQTSQLSYLTSGGIGGMVVIAIGSVLFMSYEHIEDRRAIAALEARLGQSEQAMAAGFEDLRSLLLAGRNGSGRP